MITLEKEVQRGKRTTVSEPLFPNYLFVIRPGNDPHHHHQRHACPASSHFVRFGARSNGTVDDDPSAFGLSTT
ncbi:hypothetical protein KIF59_21695 [Enterobacter cloacae subsp. cloacae]|nr:hypothetical protein [Enterobacter cloacae subsp. cloacae]